MRSFVAEKYRSGNAVGDSCKATLWHTQTIRLVMLRSRPDTVHGITLHKTLLSTFLATRDLPYCSSKKAFSSDIADFRYRVPLPPRLRTAFILYTIFLPFATVFYAVFPFAREKRRQSSLKNTPFGVIHLKKIDKNIRKRYNIP